MQCRGIRFLRMVDVLLSCTMCAVISIFTHYEASRAQEDALPWCGLEGHVAILVLRACQTPAPLHGKDGRF